MTGVDDELEEALRDMEARFDADADPVVGLERADGTVIGPDGKVVEQPPLTFGPEV